jgi:hypothetical protein
VVVAVAEAVPSSSRFPGLFIGLASVWIVFHLAAVFLMPYSESYFTLQWRSVIEPYLGAIGLQSTWRFFAPEPMAAVQQIETQLIDAKGDVIREQPWGTPANGWKFWDRVSRWNSVGFQMAAFPDRAETLLKGYLCHQPEKPYSYRVWLKTAPLPLLADVASGKRKVGDGVGAERKLLIHGFCS